MEVLFMDMEDKFRLLRICEAIRLMAWVDGNRELQQRMDEIKCVELKEIHDLETEHTFFNHLHKQSELDNVLSLMKIFKRLELDIPNIRIELTNINSTYDKLWDSINEQIQVPDDTFDELIDMMNEIIDDDELNHPNTKRKLRELRDELSYDYDLDYSYDWYDWEEFDYGYVRQPREDEREDREPVAVQMYTF